MNYIEYYPQTLALLGPYLHLKDRTKLRTLVSKDVSIDAEDYDVWYNRDLRRMTCIL